MAWWEWLLLALLVLVVVCVAAYLLVRATRRGRRFMALPIADKGRFGRNLLADRQIPWYAKLVMVVAIGYLAMPFDIIPDFVPVIGQLDDVLLVSLAVVLLLVMIPGDRFDAALTSTERDANAVNR